MTHINKKIITLFLAIVFFTGTVFAQSTENDNTTDYQGRVSSDTGRQLLREMVVESFEDPSLWEVKVPTDRAKVSYRRIIGGPLAKPVITIEDQTLRNRIQQVSITDEYVLGIKTEFYGRNEMAINAELRKPIFIPGLVKRLSLWVLGRNKRHELSIVLLDMDGNVKKLPMGTLDFVGWKKLEVVIPDSVNQENIRNNTLNGLYLMNVVVDTYFEDTVGIFYTYFDDMRIVRDAMLDVIYSAEDEISDGW